MTKHVIVCSRMSKLRPSSVQPASTHQGTGRRSRLYYPRASPVTLPSASASANCKRKWVSLVDTTGNVLRDVPLPRPRSIQHQLTAARPKMPYAAVMNRKGINREAAAHFLERRVCAPCYANATVDVGESSSAFGRPRYGAGPSGLVL